MACRVGVNVFILGILTLQILTQDAAQEDDTKRLVLHTELDMAAEIVNMKQQINTLNEEIRLLKLNQVTSTGSTYVRWGRKNCPGNGSTSVYSGFMAGTYLDQPDPNNPSDFGGGNGDNYLCLTDSPIWDHYTDAMDNNLRLTGVEYEFYTHHVTNTIADFLGNDVRGVFGKFAEFLL